MASFPVKERVELIKNKIYNRPKVYNKNETEETYIIMNQSESSSRACFLSSASNLSFALLSHFCIDCSKSFFVKVLLYIPPAAAT